MLAFAVDGPRDYRRALPGMVRVHRRRQSAGHRSIVAHPFTPFQMLFISNHLSIHLEFENTLGTLHLRPQHIYPFLVFHK